MPAGHTNNHRTASGREVKEPLIEYFVTRPDGTPVPLIPADELPSSVRLRSVPRSILPAQAYMLKCVGTAASSGLVFELENPLSNRTKQPGSKPSSDGIPASSESGRQSDGQVSTRRFKQNHSQQSHTAANPSSRSGPQYIDAQSLRKSTPSGAASLIKAKRVEGMKSDRFSTSEALAGDSFVVAGADPSQARAQIPSNDEFQLLQNAQMPPSGITPDPQRKKYCAYWIQHGSCAFEQQGCKFMHVMPDRNTLAKIGFHTIPRWWIEETNGFFKKGMPVNAQSQAQALSTTTGRREKPASLAKLKPEEREFGKQGTKGQGKIQQRALKPSQKAASASSVQEEAERSKDNIVVQAPSPEHYTKAVSRCSSDCSDLINFSSGRTRHPPSMAPMSQYVEYVQNAHLTRQATEQMQTHMGREDSTVFVPPGESIGTNVSNARRYAERNSRVGAFPRQMAFDSLDEPIQDD